jgi:hypothetical protein
MEPRDGVGVIRPSLKRGKLATSGESVRLSLLVYATTWGSRYAAGLIALLFAHEMGTTSQRGSGLGVGRMDRAEGSAGRCRGAIGAQIFNMDGLVV